MKFVKPMSRSVYKVRYPVKGSFNLGEICPIGAPIEVTPADGFKLDIYSVIRMATPIAPIMDDLDAEIAAFFVPTRLVSHKNYGDITNASGQAGTTITSFEKIIGNGVGNPIDWQQSNIEAFTAPTEKWNTNFARNQNYTSVGEALGLGLGISGTADINVLAYQLYGYNLIYQEHYRNENVEAAKTLDKTSNLYGFIGTPTSSADVNSLQRYNAALNVAYKHGDMFTNAVPNPQKGPSVPLPLGQNAPLMTGSTYALRDSSGIATPLKIGGAQSLTTDNFYNVQLKATGTTEGNLSIDNTAITPSGTSYNVSTLNLYTNLSDATAATVNSFIEAYNIQQLLMNDIKGTRYYEQLIAHFGVQNEDIKLYRPEILSINRFAINISTVVQQSGAASGAGSETDQNNMLGTTGGYSMTAHKNHAVSQDFGEFGYIYLLICIRQKHTYGQGIPKQYLRSTRFDWFFPELGRIGWQAIDIRRIDADETSTTPFGYEPAWQELRDVNHGQVFGFLNPTKSNSLDYWTLTDKFGSTPTLSISFLKENRLNLARALTIGNTGPDFIMDALIVGTKSTLVPVSNTPKLFD